MTPETIAELALEISNLAHRGWEDRANAEYLFREIGKRAQKLSEPVGASLSAQTPPTDELRDFPALRLIRSCELDAAIEKMGNTQLADILIERLWSKMDITGEDSSFLSAAIERLRASSGAAQEGDCPCGATVVRKSDSANKSKLCADCAAQEEAPSPATLQPLLNHIANRVKLLSSAQIGFEKWDACCEGIAKLLQTGWPFPDLDAIKKSGVVAEEEAGAPKCSSPSCNTDMDQCGEESEDRYICTLEECHSGPHEARSTHEDGLHRLIVSWAGAPGPQEPK